MSLVQSKHTRINTYMRTRTNIYIEREKEREFLLRRFPLDNTLGSQNSDVQHLLRFYSKKKKRNLLRLKEKHVLHDHLFHEFHGKH